MEPDAAEVRVVGCLIEKQRTTPDAYPLSLNALRLACNQATNREPVVDYDEATVSAALRRLALRGWTRLASGAGSRARKYRHLMPEALGIDDAELALLAVLMLRGPQTPGELKQRSERLHAFDGLAGVQEALERLVERGYVARHERRPGQKEQRYEQLLGGFGEAAAPAAEEGAEDLGGPGVDAGTGGHAAGGHGAELGPSHAEPSADPGLMPAEDRLTRLERELGELRTELVSLREALGEG
jgi:uncharacterized protein YceH (UPF0502 family)